MSLPPPNSASARLEDVNAAAALRQLVRGEGPMAQLCSENAAPRVDWIDTIAELLADAQPLEELAWPAGGWRRCGVRHVVWSGMFLADAPTATTGSARTGR